MTRYLTENIWGGKYHRACSSAGCLFAFLLIFAPFALVASSPSAEAQSAGAQAQTPAPDAPAPSPAALAYAREIVLGSGMERSFSAIVTQVMDQIDQTTLKTRPEIKTQLRETMTQMMPELLKLSDDMVAIATNIIVKKLSEQELKDVAAFFASASGKKYVAVQPDTLNEIVVAMQGWSQKLSVDILARVREEMKKKSIDL